MSDQSDDKIAFDVLLKGPATDSGREPSLESLEDFRPSPAAIDRCRRWLATKSVVCDPTDFGLACTAPKSVFESLFSVRLQPAEPRPGLPRSQMKGELQVPEEIADLVDQVTLTGFPELF